MAGIITLEIQFVGKIDYIQLQIIQYAKRKLVMNNLMITLYELMFKLFLFP